MGRDRQQFSYYLPRTVVRFAGSRQETTDSLAGNAPPVVETVASVATAEQADPGFVGSMDLDSTFLRDVDGGIGFTTDRRLSSLSATSAGAAAKLTTGVIRVVTSTLGALAALRQLPTGSSASTASTPLDPEAAYLARCPEAAAHRAAVREAVVGLRSAIVATTAKAEQADAAEKLRHLLAALRTLTDLQAQADLHFEAWRASTLSTTAQDLAFEVPVLSLPPTEDVDARVASLDRDVLGECWDSFERLGIFAAGPKLPDCRVEAGGPREPSPGFVFRHPRPVWLSIYRRVDNEPTRAALIERRLIQVYDALSPTEYVNCRSGVWNRKSVVAELDGGSAPSKITIGVTGTGGEIGAGLAGAAEQVTTGLTDADALVKAVDGLRDHAMDRQLALLDRRKQALEKQIAADAMAADVSKLRELAGLEHEKSLLTMRKEVAELTAPPRTEADDAVPVKRIVLSLEA